MVRSISEVRLLLHLLSWLCFFLAAIPVHAYHHGEKITFTLDELEFIQNHPEIRVGGAFDSPPVGYVVDGQYTGLSSDYLKIIEEETGIRFNIVTGYTRNELLNMLIEQRVDLLPTIYRSDSRGGLMHFTAPYMTLRHYAFSQEGRDDLRSIRDLAQKVVVVPQGYLYLEKLREDYPEIKIMLVNGTMEAIDAIVTGRADVMIESTASISHILREQNIQGIVPVFSVDFGINSVHMAVRQDWPVLRDIIEKVLKNLDVQAQRDLIQNWMDLPLSDQGTLTRSLLSAQEIRYLKQKQSLKACIDPSWLPYEGFKDGKVTGMTSEYLEYFQNQLDIPISVVETESWSQTLAFAQNRKCDFLPLAGSKPERRKYLNFTTPYLKIPLALATKMDEVFFADFSELDGKRIGIIAGFAPEVTIRKAYPNIDLVGYDSILSGLNDVQNGEILGFVDSVFVLSYQIQSSYPG